MQTVLSREGNNATSVKGHNMQLSANQMSSSCLLREACSRRSDFGNGAKRCEQGTTGRGVPLPIVPCALSFFRLRHKEASEEGERSCESRL